MSSAVATTSAKGGSLTWPGPPERISCRRDQRLLAGFHLGGGATRTRQITGWREQGRRAMWKLKKE